MPQNKQVKYYFILAAIVVLSTTKVHSAITLSSDTSTVNSLLQKAKVALDSNKAFVSYRLSKSALSLSNRINYEKGIATSLYYIGNYQSTKGSKDSAITTLKESLEIFKRINNMQGEGNSLNCIGNVFANLSIQDSAEFYYNKALEIRQKLNDKIGVASSYNNLGFICNSRGQYSKALDYYLQALSIGEEVNIKTIQPVILINIGVVAWSQGGYQKALEYLFKALRITEETKDLKHAGLINNDIGVVYQETGDYKMAIKYHNESIKIKQLQGDSLGISYSYHNLGRIYELQGNFGKAIQYYNKAELLKKELSDIDGLANLYSSMGELYRKMKIPKKSLEILTIAERIFEKVNNPRELAGCLIQKGLTLFDFGLKGEAISYCLKGITLAKRIGALDLVKLGYESLSKMYEGTGRITQAFDAYKLFIFFRDSLHSIEKSKEELKIQMQSEFDKLMQKQKLEQEKKLVVAQGESEKLSLISNIFILAFAITFSISILFFIYFKQKQKSNHLLTFQKLDVERQKQELMIQRDELEIQKNLVIHQRDKIINMLTDLGESIDYARKIQQALLPSDRYLKKLLGDYFLLFQPRESVGGDFYWVAQYEHLTFFAVADCTGHGVPGGFMSMLGVSLLNELVSRAECASPAMMLWNLREMIIKALNQTGLDEDSQDGMDIALCMYNTKNHHLVYSGANLSIIIVTSTPPHANDRVYVQGNVVELKPDRMPVAYYQRMVEYYEHHLVLNPGDSIYLFSDGYSDQFGGQLNKKFGYSTFRNLIASASSQPIDMQKDIFRNKFDKWKGDEYQTDDVIILGIKLL